MPSEILINKMLHETRVAKIENGLLVELNIERASDSSLVGNIYKGRVTRVLPGMQAAFVELGLARTGFLHVSDILDPEREAPRELERDEGEESAHSEENPAEDNEDAEAKNGASYESTRNISEVIREGESLLVQVVKEPMGTKGARLTGYISIPGRYLVYLPDTRHLGISRRIEARDERERLRQIVEKNMPAQGGFIIRTVAEGASAKNLKDDMEYLIKLWGSIKKTAEKQKDIGLVYNDLDITTKIIRDRVTDDVERIVIDDLESFKKITKFIQSFLPRFKKRIVLYTDVTPMFDQFGIEVDIARALSRKVWLKSGGYIVIDQTEALTSIDVNTGRFVGRRNLEDTILQTNLEALKEIAYQIRLRNLGGIIVIDFIDMNRPQFRDRTYQAFLEELQKDPARTHVLPISDLGLIQMTRKRTQASLTSRVTAPCKYCDGRGYVKSHETIAYQIMRDCQKEVQASKGQSGGNLTVYCHPSIAHYFAEEERSTVAELEKLISMQVTIKVDPKLHLEEYEIFTRES